jgi:hypothetical protein
LVTFIFWKLGKNVYGACAYVALILCCEYDEISEEVLGFELNAFGEAVRHDYETVKAISMIKKPTS